jgi:hypothetical protein
MVSVFEEFDGYAADRLAVTSFDEYSPFASCGASADLVKA